MSRRRRRAESVIEEQAYLPILLQGSSEYQQNYGGKSEQEIPRDHTLESVLHRANIEKAWKRVRSNKGGAGVDGMKVDDFSAFFHENWEKIALKLREGRYRPSPVRQCQIPKGNGEFRTLGIPTVLDRVIQQAIAQVIGPSYDSKFSDSSHGYRPQRSAQGAMKQLLNFANARGTKCMVVDCDLKQFFDTVDHQLMMQKLRQNITDASLLGLIKRYLKAGAITSKGELIASPEGMPQGGPLSPLLANILLDDLDKELHRRGHQHVRYADDFIILCNSKRAGERILKSITNYLATKLRLTVNTTKSKVISLKEASYLGFRIYRRKIRWTERAKQNLKDKVRLLTNRSRGVSITQVYSELRNTLRGYLNYFMIGVTFREVRELDHWLRRRMRLLYWKQWKQPRTRRRNLLKLGVDRERVKLASRSRKGPWRICNVEVVRYAMTNQWLADKGLVSLTDQWVKARYKS